MSAIFLSQGYLSQVKFTDIAQCHICLKGLYSPERHHFPTQPKLSTRKREKWSEWMGSLEEWRRRSEQAAWRLGGVSVTSQMLYPRELKHLVVVGYVLKDANVSSADFHFSLSICASPTFASSFSPPASHCQAGALMFNMLFPPPPTTQFLCQISLYCKYRMEQCVLFVWVRSENLTFAHFTCSLKMNGDCAKRLSHLSCELMSGSRIIVMDFVEFPHNLSD